MSDALQVVIVDDDTRFRESIGTFLGHAPGFELCAAFGSAETLLSEARRLIREGAGLGWDLVLMDIHLGGTDGIQATEELRGLSEDVRIVMLTSFQDSRVIVESIAAGANGYLLKKSSSKDLLFQLKSVMEGGSPLTPGVASTVLDLLRESAPPRSGVSPSPLNLTEREREVLRCLVDGCRYSEAAERLGIGAETVKSHVHAIYRKLQVGTAACAVREALRRGLV